MALVRKLHASVVMRIAIPQWQGRIAPVFDVAAHLLLVDVEDNRETHREEKRLAKVEFAARAAEVLSDGANILICGAISAPLQWKITASGIPVIAFICGAVDEVLAAYLNGTLVKPAFIMPGCHRWRWQGGQDVLPGGFGMGGERGRFRQGRGGIQATAAREGLSAATVDVYFICPRCGEKVCRKKEPSMARNVCPVCPVCPKCGGSMAPF